MKIAKFLLLFAMVVTMSSFEKEVSKNTTDNSSSDAREFYQLKIYTFNNSDQQLQTDSYLKEAFLQALKRLKINNVGVFKNFLTEKDSIRKTFVLIPFSNINQFLDLETSLEKDTAYKAAGTHYINAAHDARPYNRMESILMKAFIDMPKIEATTIEGPRAERIYELRSYESPTEKLQKNKVDMFNAGGEINLFEKLGFHAVFYAEVISGSKMPNLMYMTTFKNMESRDLHWDAFRDAPEWLTLKANPKYQKNVSRSDIMLLYPTGYSDY